MKLKTARTSPTSSSRVIDNKHVLGWNLGPHTSYSLSEYTLFSSVLQENPGMVGLRNPATTISIYIRSSSLSRLPFDAVQSVLLVATINTQWINNKQWNKQTNTALDSHSHTSTNLYNVRISASNTTKSHCAWRRDDRFLYRRLPAEWEIVPDPHGRRQTRSYRISAKFRHRRIWHCGLIHIRGALKARVIYHSSPTWTHYRLFTKTVTTFQSSIGTRSSLYNIRI